MTALDREWDAEGGDPTVPTAYGWLRHHAGQMPAAAAVTVCHGERGDERYSFAELLTLADRAAAGLRALGVRSGDRIALSLPNDVSFPAVLFGCLAVGAIAVPAPVPGVRRVSAFRERMKGIVGDCAPHLVVTTATWASLIVETVAGIHPGATVALWPAFAETDDALQGRGVADLADTALLQYTSGSTKKPRGVVITHDMLRASCHQAAVAYLESSADVAVSWVPLYHDMGLVTGVMRPVFTGYESVLLQPETFARAPVSWLRAIDKHRGTLSSAPDFAYELCTGKTRQEQVDGLDLSTWRVARNAGEVVRPQTLARFTARFSGSGLRLDAMCPSYGLAEATLTVTSCGPGRSSLRITVPATDLVSGRDVIPVADGEGVPAAGAVLQSSGMPLSGTEVYIDGVGLEGRVGRISVKGPQVSPGYWPGPVTDAEKPPRVHETGDLGFCYRGHLFVLGRVDDTLVRNGQNYYASDVRDACARVDGVRPGRVAAFLLRAEDHSKLDVTEAEACRADQVVVVAELRADADTTASALKRREFQVREELARALDLYATRVAFLPAGELPVTTSGKIRITEVRRRFAKGSLPLLELCGRESTDGT
jgi:acyl-CoA synthetase (AMP-forming)/AMP-acid ligase II